MALKDRLQFDDGAVHDGPRRYLLMRPDVLMGAVVRLDDAARKAWLAAAAEAAFVQGIDSLRAYAAQRPGDAQGLVQATVEAAADLGWGRWRCVCSAGRLELSVGDSPFAEGWRAAGGAGCGPICAPVAGLLQALGSLVLGGTVRAHELQCAADGRDECRFVAERA